MPAIPAMLINSLARVSYKKRTWETHTANSQHVTSIHVPTMNSDTPQYSNDTTFTVTPTSQEEPKSTARILVFSLQI